MSNHSPDDGLLLPGLDGTNPLGFLAALGVLELLTTVHCPHKVTMSWSGTAGLWNPVLHGVGKNQRSIADAMAKLLNCPFTPSTDADNKREETQAAFDDKKSELKKTAQQLKKRGLRGNERDDAEERVLGPIRVELAALRAKWLEALRESVPSIELSIGKHLNATCGELREQMMLALAESTHRQRDIIDLYAAFGSDACSQEKSDQMRATYFCFITGSGHQYFLDTVRQLVESVTVDRLESAMFSRFTSQDEKFSMRWDPQEDRRYAVMWSDPTSSGNKATTNWALNLLAYRGLQCLPSIPRANGLRTVGWLTNDEPAWNWPVWTSRISSAIVRSLLSHPILTQQSIERGTVSALGVAAVYQSARVQVGKPPLHKVNFTPSQRVA